MCIRDRVINEGFPLTKPLAVNTGLSNCAPVIIVVVVVVDLLLLLMLLLAVAPWLAAAEWWRHSLLPWQLSPRCYIRLNHAKVLKSPAVNDVIILKLVYSSAKFRRANLPQNSTSACMFVCLSVCHTKLLCQNSLTHHSNFSSHRRPLNLVFTPKLLHMKLR